MSQIQAKQVKKIFSGPVKIVGLSVPSSSLSIVVTTQLTSACTSAGDNGTSVPLVSSAATTANGIAVTAPANKCEIWNNTTKQKFTESTSQNEIYGKLTIASTTYTLSFFYIDNTGTENTYTFTSGVTIDFDFIYRYRFHELPADAAVSTFTKNVFQDPKGVGSVEFNEKLTVTSTNTLSNLGNIPGYATRTKLDVNGKIEYPIGVSPAFTVSSNTIVWSAANAGYNLETTDEVFVTYYI